MKKLDILSNDIMISALTVSKKSQRYESYQDIAAQPGYVFFVFFTGRVGPGREGYSNAHGCSNALGSGREGCFKRSRFVSGRVGRGVSNVHVSFRAGSGEVFRRSRVVPGRVGRGIQTLTGRVRSGREGCFKRLWVG